MQKTSWADDVEDLGESIFFTFVSSYPNHCLDQVKGEDYVDENGIRTTVEYTVNDEGKKIKACHG